MGRLVMMVTLISAVLATPGPDPGYRAEIEKWRQQREARLKAEDGWLAVAGLFWLDEGANRFGSGPGNSIALPANAAPPAAGTFELRQGNETARAEPGGAVAPARKPNPATPQPSHESGPRPE